MKQRSYINLSSLVIYSFNSIIYLEVSWFLEWSKISSLSIFNKFKLFWQINSDCILIPHKSGIKFFHVVFHSYFKIEIRIELHLVRLHNSSLDGGFKPYLITKSRIYYFIASLYSVGRDSQFNFTLSSITQRAKNFV